MYSSLILAAAANVPTTLEWSPKIAIVMVICNIIAIALAKNGIQQPNVGPSMPSPEMFGGFSLGAVIGATCFGHILGVGVILGLAASGTL